MFKLKTAPERKKDLFEALQFIQRQVQLKQECMSCRIFKAIDDQTVFLYIEQWKTRDAMEYHIKSSLYSKVLAIMELATIPPEISFHHIKSSESIDLISRLRKEI